jgi:hypothetical protein
MSTVLPSPGTVRTGCREAALGDQARDYEIAGVTMREESDLPIMAAVFDKEPAVF